eukprot:gene17670-27192_t
MGKWVNSCFLATVLAAGALQVLLFSAARGGESVERRQCAVVGLGTDAAARTVLYNKMSADAVESESFHYDSYHHPTLTHLRTPVCALVLPLLDKQVAGTLLRTLTAVFRESHVDPFLQNSSFYHVTLLHSRNASRETVAVIKHHAGGTCALEAAIQRVVVTRSGVVAACWQVISDTSLQPGAFRDALSDELGVPLDLNRVVIHTTLARLPFPSPVHPRELAASLTRRLCGLRASFSTLWILK